MKTQNQMAALSGLCNQAALCEIIGKLHEAERLYAEALTLTQDSRGRPAPLAGVPLTGLGKLYRQWDRLGEAAERLVISIATVKKHIENIHGKLYVRNRTQAVARARELGLL
jgi:hypothetical protein